MTRTKLSLKKKQIEVKETVELNVICDEVHPELVAATPTPEPRVLSDEEITHKILADLVWLHFQAQPVFTPILIEGKKWMRPLSGSVRPALMEWLRSQPEAKECETKIIKSAVASGVFRYVIKDKYIKSILKHGYCYNLDGDIDGKVSDHQIQEATKRLSERTKMKEQCKSAKLAKKLST